MLRPECASCRHSNPPGSRYCTHCGTQLALLACPACEALNDVTARTCHECGAELRERVGALNAGSYSGSADPQTFTGEPAAHNPGADASASWAGSSPAAFGSLRGSPPSRSFLWKRVVPVLLVAAVAVAALLGWLAHRNSSVGADAVNTTPALERNAASNSTAGPTSSPGAGKGDAAAGGDRDGRVACTEAVAALGLCSR